MINIYMPLPPYKDTRSEAQKMQQKLFLQLGSLYRIRANLRILYDETSTANQARLQAFGLAIKHINVMIDDNSIAMRNLPNKKRKALLTSEKKCVE